MTQRYFLFAGIILCAFIAAILSHIAFHHANEPAEQNISCNAHVINFTDHTKMDQYFSLNMISENNTANMYLTGAYTVDGKKMGFIRRYVSFTYKKFRDTVYFTTVKIQKIQKDDNISDEILENITSDFFIKVDTSINFYVTRQNDYNYVFSTGRTPRFICISH
ncbi:TPA: FidL [Escherichia coli]|nr:FidL [Escherichia coli]HEH9938614.1 FidL [Escherichia coli]HEH9952399.1 FidL [Escherichia coli]